MDGGSSLNLLYQDTVRKMGIDPPRIKPTKTTFKGVIPGVEACCTGSITLEVVFGSLDNFRSEELIFDIVPFHSGYHALLGRTALCIPHDQNATTSRGHNSQWKHRTLAPHRGAHCSPRSGSTKQPSEDNRQFGEEAIGNLQENLEYPATGSPGTFRARLAIRPPS